MSTWIQIGRRVARISVVTQKVGLSRSTLWRLTRAGLFPAPVQLSARCVGWDLDEIDQWLEQRAATRATKFSNN
jgi:prophage regulatory protein